MAGALAPGIVGPHGDTCGAQAWTLHALGCMETNFYSKARIAGHPIHPMLVHFPIALFIGGVLAFLAFVGIGDLFWYRVAAVGFIAGAVFAVLAAIAGMIDLYGAIPPGSAARRTGIKHMGLNLVAVVLFAGAGILMNRSLTAFVSSAPNELSVGVPLVLSVIGAVLVTVAGALGSKLVHKEHVGQRIDDRGPTANVPRPSGTVAADVGRTAY